jgi:GNAT superfamily N-acetyltransferase
MIRQLVYPTIELPSALQDQILTFLRWNWPEGFWEESRSDAWISSPENHPVHIVLVNEGNLVSHVEVVWKYLAHAGEIYKAYGLSGAFTCPTCRNQGYGRQIIEAGTAYIKASEADIGLLWCAPSLKEFYTGLGWTGLKNAKTLIGPPEAPRFYRLLLMMLFLSQRGWAGKSTFESEPIYFGVTAW